MVWNKGNPAAGIKANQLDDEIRVNNLALETVIDFGHDLVSAETGWHNSGSAQIYSGTSTPAFKEDGATVFSTTDIGEKVWLDENTTPGILKVLTSLVVFTSVAELIGMIDDDTLATASAVLPASSESIKAYVDAEQLLDVKVDGSAAFTADQPMGTNKITGLGDPDDPQDAATMAYVDTNATNRIQVGTYAGDGNATKAISGLNFQPDYVMIVPELTQDTHLKTSDMPTAGAQNITADGQFNTDSITSLDSDGFTVGDGTGDGSDDDMNVLGENYYWTAMKNS